MPRKDSSTRELVGCSVLALVTERILRREYCLCGRSDVKPCVCVSVYTELCSECTLQLRVQVRYNQLMLSC